MDTVHIFATLAIKGPLQTLGPLYERANAARLEIEYAPTLDYVKKIRAGERADVAVLTDSAIGELAAEGILDAQTHARLVTSLVGVAVRAGAKKPDLSSADAFRRMLLDAESLSYSRSGASGIYFAQLIEKWGIADAVNRKARISTGFAAEKVASGEVEIAIQQVSELLAVQGIELAGPLPEEIQFRSVFSGAVFTASQQPYAARRFLEFIRSDDVLPALRAAGLERA